MEMVKGDLRIDGFHRQIMICDGENYYIESEYIASGKNDPEMLEWFARLREDAPQVSSCPTVFSSIDGGHSQSLPRPRFYPTTTLTNDELKTNFLIAGQNKAAASHELTEAEMLPHAQIPAIPTLADSTQFRNRLMILMKFPPAIISLFEPKNMNPYAAAPLPWKQRLIQHATHKCKHRVIYDREGIDPYLIRYYLHPRWMTFGLFRVVVHNFCRSDNPNDGLHDHPWPYISVILSGGYIEHTPEGSACRHVGQTLFRRARSLHRVQLYGDNNPVYTLFIMGPKIRRWGFTVDGQWHPWKKWIAHRSMRK